jgi:hypothetical protein
LPQPILVVLEECLEFGAERFEDVRLTQADIVLPELGAALAADVLLQNPDPGEVFKAAESIHHEVLDAGSGGHVTSGVKLIKNHRFEIIEAAG